MKEIWVLAEHAGGELARVSFELLSEAARLARKLDASVAALILSDDSGGLCDGLARHGAGTVYVVDDRRLRHYDPNIATATMARLCRSHEPLLVIFAATSTGSDLAVRLATSEGWPLVARCVNFELRDGSIRPVRALAQGTVHGVYATAGNGPVLVTIAPETLGVERPDPDRPVRVTRVPAQVPPRRLLEVGDFVPGDPRMLDLREAERVIGVGRGIGTRENLHLVEEFADAIGASIACTRPLVDMGWLPHARQIGQTGISVKPRLYIACGISGATQHVLGIREADTIVAINNDPGAPIFELADLGIVGNIIEVLPALTARCRVARAG